MIKLVKYISLINWLKFLNMSAEQNNLVCRTNHIFKLTDNFTPFKIGGHAYLRDA
jgi:hypothetical protein